MSSHVARSASSPAPDPSTPRHCPDAEYRAFVDGLSRHSAATRRKLLAFYRRFVRTYPDLHAWFDQPLRYRLGWRTGDTQNRRRHPGDDFDVTGGWINFNARPYLVYLALTGRLCLDWGWLLGIGVLKPWLVADQLGLPLNRQAAELQERLIGLGHARDDQSFRLPWALIRLVLHRGDPDLNAITFDDVEGLRQAIRHLDQIPDIARGIPPERWTALGSNWGTSAFRAGMALFHAGITDRAPMPYRGLPRPPLSSKPRIAAVMERFLAERALVLRPDSMSTLRGGLRRLGLWLDTERLQIDSLDQLSRADLVAFMQSVHQARKIKHPDQPISPAFRAGIISTIAVFFRYGALAEWPDMPARPLLTHADMPRRIQTGPAVHSRAPTRTRHEPHPRPGMPAATLRAAGRPLERRSPQRDRKLHLDCLDTYPDGTPRLRLAAGKALKERTVPLHQEAADAIRNLIKLRTDQPDRGIIDPDLGHSVRYLFLRNGSLTGADYLFADPLAQICAELAILTGDGKPAIHAHRFRHTLGTQLAEKGARMQTIMKVLGHKSPGMSMTYTTISDPTVLADYQAVLQPGAVIAGPLVETLRAGQLDQEALDWLKTNFYKTELELGRCLRLPQEGPCECDLYLSCAKFVTTPQYAPRLRARLCTERQLAADAAARGWDREIDRHQRTADRIASLLDDLGEPHDEPLT